MVQRIFCAFLLVLACAAQAVPEPAAITSPPDGATLGAPSQTFEWNAAPRATLYQLWVGSSVGAYDIGYFPATGTTATSLTVDGLPSDGRTVHVRLWSAIEGAYHSRDFTYAAASAAARITSPPEGAALAGPSQLFEWTEVPGAVFQLWVGNAPGGYDLGYFPAHVTTGNSIVASGLPYDGRTLYARLWTGYAGAYRHRDFTYRAATPAPAAIIVPANHSILAGGTQTFQWQGTPGANLYQLWIGNSPGGHDLGYFPVSGTTDPFTTVAGLPTDGRTLYARLWTMISGAYQFRDFVYTASTAAAFAAADFTLPAAGSTLAGSTQVFRWNALGGEAMYQVWIGNAIGAYDIGYFPASGTVEAAATIAGLPVDGRTLFVRLWSATGGHYLYRDHSYRASAPGDAVLTEPAEGAMIPGPAQRFTWSPSTACTPGDCALESLAIGSAPGAEEYGRIGGATGEATFLNLPVDGRALYGRLRWTREGVAHFRDHQYTAAPASPAVAIVSPPNGAQISASTITFSWTQPSTQAYANYVLWIGGIPGGDGYGVLPPWRRVGFSGTSISVNLPPNWGPKLYVRLWTDLAQPYPWYGPWYYRDFVYVRGPS